MGALDNALALADKSSPNFTLAILAKAYRSKCVELEAYKSEFCEHCGRKIYQKSGEKKGERDE